MLESTHNLAINSQKNFFDWNQFSSSLLIEVNRGGEIYTSSAVLIKRNVLLTAAHSVENIDEGYVHLSHCYKNSNTKVKFKKVVIHSEYNKELSNFKNDLALIVLEHNLPKEITPVSMDINTAESLERGVGIDRVGFGARSGKNKRTWTNPKLNSVLERHLELVDTKSVVGDSGGPLYLDGKLVGIHSTKEGEKTFAVNLEFYKNWIEKNLPLKRI